MDTVKLKITGAGWEHRVKAKMKKFHVTHSFTNLSRITRIFRIDEIERRKETQIHGYINSMAQLFHVFFAEVLQKQSK